jgi:hypothetical protein
MAAVVYLSALCKGESTNTVILIYFKRSYHKMFGNINVSCPIKFIYVTAPATIYCRCILLKVDLYSRNFEAHVIAVSLLYGMLLYLEHRCNFPIFLNDSSLYEKVFMHDTRPLKKKLISHLQILGSRTVT